MFFPRVEVFKVVILYTVVVVIGYCMFLDVSSVVTTTTRLQDAEKVLTPYNVMNKQTPTFYHYDYVSIFCFTSFNTF